MSFSLEKETVFNQREVSEGIQKQELQQLSTVTKRGKVKKTKKKQTQHNSLVVINGLKLLKITRPAFHYYRSSVKRNDKVSYITARKKLTRNTMLAMVLDCYEKNGKDWVVYAYGQLEITVSGQTIVNIRQLPEAPEGFVYHARKREKISKRLGLSLKK